jgi:hypothetical protein
MPKKNNSKRRSKNKSGRGRGEGRASERITNRVLFGSDMNNAISRVSRSGYSDATVLKGVQAVYGFSFLPTGFYMNGSFYSYAGANEPAQMYDFYRIVRVQVSLFFNNNFANVEQVLQTLPFFFDCVDYNDATVSAISDITQNSTCEMIVAGPTANTCLTTRTFTPRAQLTVYAGAGSAYAESPLGLWFNTSATPIHYGWKLGVDASLMSLATGNCGYFRVFVKCFLEYKSPR